MSELAWQQSLLDGDLVLLAGLVDEQNYLDANSYANNSQAQFLNGAFVNSSVLPLPSNNLGLSVQWQPTSSWYVLFGTGANNQPPGQSPFQDLGLQDWSYLLELGLTPKKRARPGTGGISPPALPGHRERTDPGRAGLERAAAARAALAFRLLRPGWRQRLAGGVGRRQRAGFRRLGHGRAPQAGRAGSEVEQRFAWPRSGLEPGCRRQRRPFTTRTNTLWRLFMPCNSRPPSSCSLTCRSSGIGPLVRTRGRPSSASFKSTSPGETLQAKQAPHLRPDRAKRYQAFPAPRLREEG